MIYLEMSRDKAHGGGAWGFSNCIWAPIEKSGGGSWPFWSKVLHLKAADTILHLRGTPPAAAFVGYSTVSNAGYETRSRPPEPGPWAYSQAFYRADLETFTPFHTPVNLLETFAARREVLENYFDNNRQSGASRKNIFFVRQSGRLQCLNGAYLSDVDDELFVALFGREASSDPSEHQPLRISVVTSQQLSIVRSRIGQSVFANELKKLYGYRCCFPSCDIADSQFLVASHIARWTDNDALRGHLGNGLCLCLMHDKAFEVGLFTLNDQFQVVVSASASLRDSTFMSALRSAHGEQIRLTAVVPLKEALSEHWQRVKLKP
jgi:putative restriction endonuclease